MRKIGKGDAQALTRHAANLREASACVEALLARAEDYASERSEAWEESEGGAEHAELREALEGALTAVEEAIAAIEELIPA